VVAAAVDPAHEDDLLAGVGGAEIAAEIGAFESTKKVEQNGFPLSFFGLGEEDGEIRARNFRLYACGESLHCQDTGLELVFAEDDDAAGSLFSGVKGFFEAEGAFAELDAETGAAKFAGQGESGGVEGFAEWGDECIGHLRWGSLLVEDCLQG
jgi:hypothetical protein